MRRLLRLVPPGTIGVGIGLAVVGLASYVHLALAGHNLDAADYSSLSVLWSVVFTLGIGVFFPVEQEVARLVAARHTRGLPPGPVLARGAAVAAAVLGLLLVLTVGAADLLTDRLFDGDPAMVPALGGALAALAVAHTTRGVLSGLRRFGWYGTQLGLDGGLRIGLVAILALTGVDSPVAYALVLVAAPLAAVALTAAPIVRTIGRGPAVPWPPLLRGLALLTVSSLLAQVVVNIGVINVRLLDPTDVATAGALLSALVLVRIPLFVFGSMQAALLPGLSTAAATGDEPAFRTMLRRSLAVVTALGALGGALAALFGPWLVRALFDTPDVLGHGDFAWLSVATLAYLWAMVLGQALLARDRHHAQALAWTVGVAALIVATLPPLPVALRVELGYTVGSVVAAAVMVALLRRRRTAPPAPPVAAPVPATTSGGAP
ncbi:MULTISPECIES: polysaccharide biosynthesis protein [unclassified Micromonospora]|uniref:polysaccharide biosynthesis protein n=1 Tax=unclassified Micromonospora TaxID=2617518 RepID=UPI0022B5FD15|nr:MULTISPECIES: polysaccharide biosynthesis protein [unclassified Micromonospora]MCZ7422826.1 polysaccharide biosynthesis protein [Verrucosispora sp. WMMA2121]WBB90560.1 polysaccharide biosynthesis protein [Verrucosispora sp. WMMC514]